MSQNNELLLLTGQDIPFPQGQITIHQPTLKEIGLIGEKVFLIGCQLLGISAMDNPNLKDKSNFEILMSLLSRDRENKNNVHMLFSLLFPNYQIKFGEKDIFIVNENLSARINQLNYDDFQNIIVSMFLLKEDKNSNQSYNPVDKRASKIAERFKKRKINQEKESNSDKVAVFSRYISILSIVLKIDINTFGNYTIFQIKDQMKRWQKWNAWDIHLKAQMAGATDLDEVDSWTDDIHPNL